MVIGAKATKPALLQLPPELHRIIAEHLPLSDQLVYRLQVCVSLRSLFGGQLFLARPYRFDLVEWAQAARQLRNTIGDHSSQDASSSRDGQGPSRKDPQTGKSIWDTSPSATPRPAPSKQSLTPLCPLGYADSVGQRTHRGSSDGVDDGWTLLHADHTDVGLLVRCLRFLGKLSDGRTSHLPSLCAPWTDEITVLSLLSRSGFKVASLIQLLETQPGLEHVEAVLMTSASFIDAVLWTVFVPPRVRKLNALSRGQSTHFDVQFSPSTCIDTQAIAIPGPRAKKGRGLRSGFKCLCFSNFEPPFERDGRASPQSPHLAPFHVIFHDWYDEDEARGTLDMLENSEITCNTCKCTICL